MTDQAQGDAAGAEAAAPRVLVNSGEVASDDPRAIGAVWSIGEPERDLDSNLIALPAGEGIGSHAGGDLDVLIHVVSGSGVLTTAQGPVDLAPGDVVWLPRRSRRQFDAGPDGLRYLTVHRRKRPLFATP
ncbi:MAG: cupin domain-containing protein [Microbacterium sp.]